MPTQAERVAASDRALMDAAIELIAERGYDRTTLYRVVAAASGAFRVEDPFTLRQVRRSSP